MELLKGLSNFKNSLEKTKELENLDDLDENFLYTFVEENRYVGELLNLNYEKAVVQINDVLRQKVDGITSSSFLIATRILPKSVSANQKYSYDDEDYAVVLLRVKDSCYLPKEEDKLRIRSEAAEKVFSEEEVIHVDEYMDEYTKKALNFAGLECKVVGTFYLDKNRDGFELKFGSDISNYYPNRGLKVYKPSNKVLEKIVNCVFVNEVGVEKVEVGNVRYSSTYRQKNMGARVFLSPYDLIGQKTAVFGMSRTGKSNTVKILIQSVFNLRNSVTPQYVGQLIFDPNGEYANDNIQDKSASGEAASIRKLSKTGDEIIVYGINQPKHDANRRLTKINFMDDNYLALGKELINLYINDRVDNNSAYMQNFLTVHFDEEKGFGAKKRRARRILAYKTLLYKAGFKIRNDIKPEEGMFSQDLIEFLFMGIDGFTEMEEKDQKKFAKKKQEYEKVAKIFEDYQREGTTYEKLFTAFQMLNTFINDKNSTYNSFNFAYQENSESGEEWADTEMKKILEMFKYENALKYISPIAKNFHSEDAMDDYATSIYTELCRGKIVIVDQSYGESFIHKVISEKIVKKVFNENSKKFINGEENICPILVYVEEAHNLLPKGSEQNLTNIWARLAKEGSKYNLGLVYATQEVSSIQDNILKNTSNWIVSHLNNKDEVKTLSSYYDFEDFTQSILKAQDKGFIRLKTKTNPFVVPVQVKKFEV